jgi:hypothetical protein
MLNGRRFLYLRKGTKENDGGGIYDDKVCASLRALGAEVAEYRLSAASSFPAAITSLRTGLLPEMARYWAELRELDLSSYVQWELIISHEALLPAIELFSNFGRQTWVIVHNLRSSLVDRGGRSFLGATRTIARHWEERYFNANPDATLVFLAERELGLSKGLCRNRSVLLRPGAPPSALEPKALAPSPTVVISGSYDWRLKRRDAVDLAKQLGAERSVERWTYYADRFFEDRGLPCRSIDSLPDDGAIKIGLVPDKFVLGMKLKLIWYIAHNCIVASHVANELMPEFDGISNHKKFIRHIDLGRRLLPQLERIWSEDVNINEYRQFRSECLRRFNWREQVSHAFA